MLMMYWHFQPYSLFVDSVIYILCYYIAFLYDGTDVRAACRLSVPTTFHCLLVLYSFMANKIDLI